MTLYDLVRKDLILTGVKAQNKEEALQQLFQALRENGCVKESFYDEVLKREAIYPTGIALPACNVAIPHVVPEQVLESGIALAVLDRPVVFMQMEDPAQPVEVKVIFNIALDKNGKQIEVLQQLMRLITDEATITQIVQSNSPEEILEIIRKVG